MDRDGVINVEHGYVGSRDRFEFMPGIFAFLRAAAAKGYRLVIVTNQSGVARGFYPRAAYEELTDWMKAEFQKEGVSIDLAEACFECKEGTVAPFNRASFWYKPNPGMILEAALKLDIDLGISVMLGDRARDMVSAKRAGIAKLIQFQSKEELENGAIAADTFDEVLALI